MFIEVTATDRHKADIVLATLCAMFSEHCAQPFEVEPVEVVDALGSTRSEPHVACFSSQVCRRLQFSDSRHGLPDSCKGGMMELCTCW